MMVVLLHGPLVYLAGAAPSVSLAAFLTVADGTNLFFVISGALLLPVTTSWREFVMRRVSRVLWPLLLWSVVYLAVGIAQGRLSLWDALRLQPEAPHLWYLYMAIVIYATLPLDSRAIAAVGERGVDAYLLLWLLSSLIPYWHGVVGSFEPLQHPLSLVHNCYGYVVLGYRLQRRPLPAGAWRLWLAALIGIVAVPLMEFTLQSGLTWLDHMVAVTSNVSVNAVMTAAVVFTVVQRLVPERLPDGRASRALTAVSNCTFGIYLMHVLVMDHVAAPLLHDWVRSHAIHPIMAGVALSALTFALSLAAALLLRRLLPSRVARLLL